MDIYETVEKGIAVAVGVCNEKFRTSYTRDNQSYWRLFIFKDDIDVSVLVNVCLNNVGVLSISGGATKSPRLSYEIQLTRSTKSNDIKIIIESVLKALNVGN